MTVGLLATGTALADPGPTATFGQQPVTVLYGEGGGVLGANGTVVAYNGGPSSAGIGVMRRSAAGTWVAAKIPTSGWSRDFGGAYAVSASGSTVALRASTGCADGSPPAPNAVEIRQFDGGSSYPAVAHLTAPASTGAGVPYQFGEELALSADGTAVAASAPRHIDADCGGTGFPTADEKLYVFRRTGSGNSWGAAESVPLPAQDPTADPTYMEVDQVGGLALSADGSTLAVSWLLVTDVGGQVRGSVLLYRHDAAGWHLVQTDGGSQFVGSPALSADGLTAAYAQLPEAYNAHPVLTVEHRVSATSWVPVAHFTGPQSPGFGRFAYGQHVAVSADGASVFTSDPGFAGNDPAEKPGVYGTGAVFRYVGTGGTWHYGGLLRPLQPSPTGRLNEVADGQLSVTSDGAQALIDTASAVSPYDPPLYADGLLLFTAH